LETQPSLTHEQLQSLEQELAKIYQNYCSLNLKLDLTRGKPGTEQLELSNALDGILQGNYCLPNGTDLRNYGGLDGLPEMKTLGGQLLGVHDHEILVGGNSSLTLMFQYLAMAFAWGVQGKETAWNREDAPKFLCPVPGYDRHFSICEELGISLIPVPLTGEGPDMDQVESLVKQDASIKGMWCVPRFSNPTGEVYSDQTVDRIAALGKTAGPNFRVMWDNAYAVHAFEKDAPPLSNVMERCRAHGTEDSVIITGSTSKITFAGAGVAFLGTSPNNLDIFKKHLNALTIGPDKVNQWRHVLFLKDLDGIQKHMDKQAQIIRPKFEIVLKHLSSSLDGKKMGNWTQPKGGYFISFNTLPGLAKEVVHLSAEAGVKLTPAGATYPYNKDPDNSNIRIAPTFPSLEDIDQAMQVFTTCVQLVSVRHFLK
jgi:aspartate/methionine/tyrosine aminotransferase